MPVHSLPHELLREVASFLPLHDLCQFCAAGSRGMAAGGVHAPRVVCALGSWNSPALRMFPWEQYRGTVRIVLTRASARDARSDAWRHAQALTKKQVLRAARHVPRRGGLRGCAEVQVFAADILHVMALDLGPVRSLAVHTIGLQTRRSKHQYTVADVARAHGSEQEPPLRTLMWHLYDGNVPEYRRDDVPRAELSGALDYVGVQVHGNDACSSHARRGVIEAGRDTFTRFVPGLLDSTFLSEETPPGLVHTLILGDGDSLPAGTEDMRPECIAIRCGVVNEGIGRRALEQLRQTPPNVVLLPMVGIPLDERHLRPTLQLLDLHRVRMLFIVEPTRPRFHEKSQRYTQYIDPHIQLLAALAEHVPSSVRVVILPYDALARHAGTHRLVPHREGGRCTDTKPLRIERVHIENIQMLTRLARLRPDWLRALFNQHLTGVRRTPFLRDCVWNEMDPAMRDVVAHLFLKDDQPMQYVGARSLILTEGPHLPRPRLRDICDTFARQGVSVAAVGTPEDFVREDAILRGASAAGILRGAAFTSGEDSTLLRTVAALLRPPALLLAPPAMLYGVKCPLSARLRICRTINGQESVGLEGGILSSVFNPAYEKFTE